MQDTIEEFVQLATVTAENQKEHFTEPVERILCIHFSRTHAHYFGLKKK